MMKLVRECVGKLLATNGRIEVKKNRGILFDLEHKAVLARLDHGINLRADLRVFWQIGQRQARRCANVSALPMRKSFCECRCTLSQCIRQHKRLEVSVLER